MPTSDQLQPALMTPSKSVHSSPRVPGMTVLVAAFKALGWFFIGIVPVALVSPAMFTGYSEDITFSEVAGSVLVIMVFAMPTAIIAALAGYEPARWIAHGLQNVESMWVRYLWAGLYGSLIGTLAVLGFIAVMLGPGLGFSWDSFFLFGPYVLLCAASVALAYHHIAKKCASSAYPTGVDAAGAGAGQAHPTGLPTE